MMNQIQWTAKSDVGRVRKNNEDYQLSRPDLGLWVVCDGVGGHDRGEAASQAAAEVIVAAVEKGASLEDSLFKAHDAVTKLAISTDQGKHGPNTTVVALRIIGDRWEICWVGDSRAWMWDGTSLVKITYDHTTVQKLVNWGEITEEEAMRHPDRHRLSQALGAGTEMIVPGYKHGTLNPEKQAFLLATDGLCHYDQPEKLADIILKSQNTDMAVTQLIEASLVAGGHDNVTISFVGWPKAARKNMLYRLLGKFGPKCKYFVIMLATVLLFNLWGGHANAMERFPESETLDILCQKLAGKLANKIGSIDKNSIDQIIFSQKKLRLKDESRKQGWKIVSTLFGKLIEETGLNAALMRQRLLVVTVDKEDPGYRKDCAVDYQRITGSIQNAFNKELQNLTVVNKKALENVLRESNRRNKQTKKENRLEILDKIKKYNVDIVYSYSAKIGGKWIYDENHKKEYKAEVTFEGEGYDLDGKDLGVNISKFFLNRNPVKDIAKREAEGDIALKVGSLLREDMKESQAKKSHGKLYVYLEYGETNEVFFVSARIHDNLHMQIGDEIRVDDSFFSLHGVKIIIIGGILSFVLIGGGAASFYFRSKWTLSKKELIASLEKAVIQRDIEAVERLLPMTEAFQQKEPLISRAEILTCPVAGLRIEGLSAEALILAPGPEQSLARGDKWFFDISRDPRVSRSAEKGVSIREDGEAFHIIKNAKASTALLLNGEEFSAQRLTNNDEISLSSSTSIQVRFPQDKKALSLHVLSGPNKGDHFVLVSQKSVFGRGNTESVSVELPAGPDVGFSIEWVDGHPVIRFFTSSDWQLSDSNGNKANVSAKKLALIDGDTVMLGGVKLKLIFLKKE